jgi:tRNA-binding EMAP/Myf-like protein
MISFEDFQKIDLKVAKIIKAEKIEGSEKLLKLIVDLGNDPSTGSGQDPSTGSGQGIRQIIAGISQFYKPEDLIGKEIIVVANLEPKKLMGIESQGMLLAAEKNGEPVILIPKKEVPPGTKIR